MAQTARVWVGGGRGGYDEAFCFDGDFDLYEKLKDVQIRRQIRGYTLRLHGDAQNSRPFRLPEGDVELDMVPWSAQDEYDIAAEQRKQRQYEAQRRENELLTEMFDKAKRQRVQDQDKKREFVATARAKRLAEERERLSKLELEFAQFKADVGEYFHKIGVLASQCFGGQCFGGSRRGYHSIRGHRE